MAQSGANMQPLPPPLRWAGTLRATQLHQYKYAAAVRAAASSSSAAANTQLFNN